MDEARETVEVFDERGGYLMGFGGKGDADGRFSRPRCIAAGPKGEVVVCDAGNMRLQVFDGDGNFIQRISMCWPAWAEVVLSGIRGLAVGEDSSVWVSSELKPVGTGAPRRCKFSFAMCQGEAST